MSSTRVDQAPIEELIGWTPRLADRWNETPGWLTPDGADPERAEVDDMLGWLDANAEAVHGESYWSYGGRPGHHFAWRGVGMVYAHSSKTGRPVHHTLREALEALIRKIIEP